MARMRQVDNNFDPSMDPNGNPWAESGPQNGILPSTPPAPDAVLRQFDGPGGDLGQHNLPDFRSAAVSTSPRMRQPGAQATPRRPSSPAPAAGSVQTQDSPGSTGIEGGLIPFEPMDGVSGAALAQPIGQTSQLRRSGLFGSIGGLQGGGLGNPFDPIANESSDPIETILKKLMGGEGGGY